MRTIGRSKALPTIASTASDGGSEYTARVDHTHQLFEPWTPVDVIAPWTGYVEMRKAGNICQFHLSVSNVGAVTNVFASAPGIFRPKLNQMFTGSYEGFSTRYPCGLIIASNGDFMGWNDAAIIGANDLLEFAGVFLLD
jgi:hypothetical protein